MPEWVIISFSKGSSWLKDQTSVSCMGRWILYHWATREAQWMNNLAKHLLTVQCPDSSIIKAAVFLIWCLFHLMLSIKISRGCKSRCCLIFSLRRLSKSNFPANRRQIWHSQVLVCHFASSEVSLHGEDASELLINSIFFEYFSHAMNFS